MRPPIFLPPNNSVDFVPCNNYLSTVSFSICKETFKTMFQKKKKLQNFDQIFPPIHMKLKYTCWANAQPYATIMLHLKTAYDRRKKRNIRQKSCAWLMSSNVNNL